MKILNELRRRNILRFSVLYVVASWLLLQAAARLEGSMSLPAWFDVVVLATLVIGFPLTLIFAWSIIDTDDN